MAGARSTCPCYDAGGRPRMSEQGLPPGTRENSRCGAAPDTRWRSMPDRLAVPLIAALLIGLAPPADAGDRQHDVGSADDTVGIVVRLSDPPVSRYAGGVAGLAATSVEGTGKRLDRRSRAVVAYRARLAARQDAFVSAVRSVAPRVDVLHRYEM